MPRYKITPEGKFQLTDAEELEIDAEEKAWSDGANDRLAAEHRATRNELLVDSDWTQMPDSPLADEVKTSWSTYRSSLRSLPENENWPNLEDADWPTKPS